MRDYSLERVQQAYYFLGKPLENIKVIHIAGTNGKGSVANMLYSIFTESESSVGIFTSPHLLDIRERFRTNTSQITQQEFLDCVNKIEASAIQLSYFERCTLIAFLFFEMRWVEYVIVEVWCWGLLDSTNIVNPFITAITSIGIDHVELLWNSLEEISMQKAGIIKPWVPIVYNHENAIIAEKAQEQGAPIIFTDKKYDTNLAGEYQKANAAIAYEIASYGWVSEDQINRWLQRVEHLWRLQYLENNILVDGAHNEMWLKALKKYIDWVTDSFTEIIYCIALKKWKTVDLIHDIFWNNNNYIFVDTQHNMCESALILQQSFHPDTQILSAESIKKQALKNPETLYVVFGSLYMIGDFYTRP